MLPVSTPAEPAGLRREMCPHRPRPPFSFYTAADCMVLCAWYGISSSLGWPLILQAIPDWANPVLLRWSQSSRIAESDDMGCAKGLDKRLHGSGSNRLRLHSIILASDTLADTSSDAARTRIAAATHLGILRPN
ncbi:hypothetical protein PG993_011992 [Apiospora rasikravindrae]|uniref:Uncharacterized protein n=1 Tax=Apiospora rasikravindrae TaxID=990691 RepID=A0ABR1S173_9PEZI